MWREIKVILNVDEDWSLSSQFRPHFSPRLPLRYTKKALILRKATPIFCDSPNSASFSLYRAILEMKMTANSTYWREDIAENSLTMLCELSQKITWWNDLRIRIRLADRLCNGLPDVVFIASGKPEIALFPSENFCSLWLSDTGLDCFSVRESLTRGNPHRSSGRNIIGREVGY